MPKARAVRPRDDESRKGTRTKRGFSKVQFRGAQNNAVRFFEDTQGLSLDPQSAYFSRDNTNVVIKRALVMVEGDHIDSKKKAHSFDAKRIQEIARNTNAFLSTGGRVPWQSDHDKTQNATLGDLEGEVFVEKITAQNLPDPRATHLIGKLGIFCDQLVGKGKRVVEDLVDGKIVTLSPGIDTLKNTIREISATPTPAIVGLRVFRRGEGSTATSWEDLEEEDDLDDQIEEEYHKLCQQFFEIISGIVSDEEENLEESRLNLYNKAKQGFVERLDEVFQVSEEAGEPVQAQMSLSLKDVAAYMQSGSKTAEFRKKKTLRRSSVGQNGRGLNKKSLEGLKL